MRKAASHMPCAVLFALNNLYSLDAEYGNLWRFVFLNEDGHFILECTNPGPGTAKDSGDHGSSAFLTPDLSLHPDRGIYMMM